MTSEGRVLPGPVLCVVGPTASGKSEVAELVAERLGSEVISVDAMQVYRGMDIGTAKTPPSERRVPLRLVDVADMREDFSAARFQCEARAVIDDLLRSHRVPVLCGGTGLYLDAVIDDMAFPSGTLASPSRTRYEELGREKGPEALWRMLNARDPESAALIHPNNAKRVARALELVDEGRSYAVQHEGLKRRAPWYDARIWALTWDRDELYARIERRVDTMFAAGLVDEVRSLRARGLDESPTASAAIGYKEVSAALRGEISLDEAREQVKRNTRRYAKRQLSWIRRDGRAHVLTMGPDGLSPAQAARRIIDDSGVTG